MRDHPSLLDIHGGLSALVHAVKLAIAHITCGVDVRAHWQDGIYLSVTIETHERYKQAIVDVLMVGALQGGYDYRFTVSYPTMPCEPSDRVVVTAYPDMHHKRKP